MYTILILIFIVIFVLIGKYSIKMLENYNGNESLQEDDFIIGALMTVELILIIAIIVFAILEIRFLVIINEYPTYESRIEILKEDNKKIDKRMKAIVLSIKPEVVDTAKEKEVNLDGCYVDVVSALDSLSHVDNVKDLLSEYKKNNKKIKDMEEKKNNISIYKSNIFPLWKWF